MSVSSLPEWKQLLLDRKRRGEEARERQEREQEEKLANMPAWKRGIIQRRRAKQESVVNSQTALGSIDAEHPSSGSALTTCTTVERSEPQRQDSTETVSPVRQSPFIRSQSGLKVERTGSWEGNEQDIMAEWEDRVSRADLWRKEREGGSNRYASEEHRREKEKEQGTERDSPRHRGSCGESEKTNEGVMVRGIGKGSPWGRTEGEKAADRPHLYNLPVQGIRTIQVENVVIVESERGGAEKEKQSSRRKVEKETEEGQRNEGRTVNSRDVTGIGGSGAFHVKSSTGVKDRSMLYQGVGKDKDEESHLWREREGLARYDKHGYGKSPSGNWPAAQVHTCQGGVEADIAMARDAWEPVVCNSNSAELPGRVSRLLSKFGENRKTPSHSRSTDCFTCPDRAGERQCEEQKVEGEHASGFEEDEDTGREERGEAKDIAFRGVPKRMFAFSSQVTVDKDGRRVDDKVHAEKEAAEMICCGGRVQGRCCQGAGVKSENQENAGMGCQDCCGVPAQGGRWKQKKTAAEEDAQVTEDVQQYRMERALGRAAERMADTSPVKDVDDGAKRQTVWTTGPERAAGVPVLFTRDAAMSIKCSKTEDKNEMERECQVARETHGERMASPHRDGEKQAMIKELSGAERMSLESQKLHWNIPAVPGGGKLHLFKENRPGPSSSTEHHSPQVRDNPPSEVVHCAGNSTSLQETEIERESGRGTKTTANKDIQGDTGNVVCVSPSPGQYRRTDSHTKRDPDGSGQNEAAAHRTESRQQGHLSVMGEVQGPAAWPDGEGKQGVHSRVVEVGQGGGRKVAEWRESWEAGQLLTNVKSMRGRAGQRELERQREMEGKEQLENRWEEEEGPAHNTDCVERENKQRGQMEVGKELQLREMAEMQSSAKKRKENTTATESERMEQAQEGPRPTASSTLDVKREAGMSKPCPPLPASVSPSRLLLAAGSEAGGTLSSPHFHSQERQEEEKQHVEELERCWQGRRFTQGGGKEEKDEEESPQEDCSRQGLSLLSTSSSDASPLSVSPSPFPSAVDMSRIYNLKPVVARTALSVGEKKADQPPPGVKVERQEPTLQLHWAPLLQDRPTYGGEVQEQQRVRPNWQQLCHRRAQGETGSKVREAPLENAGVQTVKRQLELLKIQAEPQRPSGRPLGTCPDQEQQEGSSSEQRASPKPLQVSGQHLNQRTYPEEKEGLSQRVTPQQLQNQKPQQQPDQCQPSKTFTVDPKSKRSIQTTPPNPECGGAASISTSLSPSPTPSSSCASTTTLFGLRSTSAVQSKRGNTITITPRRAPVVAAAPQAQTTTPDSKEQDGKKRYPTVDEIKVIGGYQTLEKSCLAKRRGTPKGVKVCFDEAQLESVCEYPSESSMLASLPDHPPEAEERVAGQDEEEDEEEEEDAGAFMSTISGIAGAGAKRILRVDESCRR